ncbi:MAG: class II fructose-bisphosphate aldolase [Clostridia bacterium]|nr:class II fructose-bisphosphate aldolase [Clostridia bacterium]
MSFVDTKEMLKSAQAGGYAVGAFNVENLEMIQAVISAAEKENSPVIIQTTPGTLNYAPPEAFAGAVRALAEESAVPVALHLDHGNSFELAARCAKAGYSSIMIDGSLLPFEENVSLSESVVKEVAPLPVEAELGTVGGKEDTHSAGVSYTDPAQAAEFVSRTGISSFAPAIGTAHGVYKAEPKLNLPLLDEIRSAVSVPLVLHGTSGVPDETVKECIKRGICKVNYATELRITFSNAVRKALADMPEAFDPKKYLGEGRAAVEKRVRELIGVCGSNGKA